ncbi:MAG: glycoside hydrolase family 2 TIM barrel-domain containing protein [Bacteroidota bacterium]|nr:glycoside hydrolase family 2 TIM barrel-domain containing protein [Bacteroidota bacterium]
MEPLKYSLLFICLFISTQLFAFQRTEINFNNSWKFHKSDTTGVSEINFADSHWEQISLPHTWNNLDGQDGGNDYYRGPAWYRKHFYIPKEDVGKKIFIKFDAANMIADVFVNGKFVGSHAGGYAAFVFDITENLFYGKDNVVAVKVDNTSYLSSSTFHLAPLRADFTMCGGLHRSAWLIVTNPVHITPLDYGSHGVYIMQKNVSSQSASLQITTKLRNDSNKERIVTAVSVVFDADNLPAATSTSKISLKRGGQSDVVQHLSIRQPHLWNGRSDPYMYFVVVSLYVQGKKVDEVVEPLGLRYFSIDPEKGFFLNGQPYDLHGFNRHEDKKDKGRAVSDTDREDDMRLILDIGSTVVRLAHYQHADKMYELCDKNGIIAWAEIPLVDCISPEQNFADNAKTQLIELIRQNYNHPSICFWSLFNEIYLREGPDPVPLIKELNSLAHSEDSTRPTVGALNANAPAMSIPNDIAINKYFGWYEGEVFGFGPFLDDLHKKYPHNNIGVSEYGAGGNIFQHQEKIEKTVHNAMWHPEEYQMYVHEETWKQLKARPYLWIKTLWTGFDFSVDQRLEGFSAGVNDKGLITHDHATKKDAYYWYKVNWNSEPMVFITGKHFATRDTNRIDVKTYSNASEVELFVNEKSLGKKTSDDYRFVWNDVALNTYQSNKIKAIAIVNGKEISDQCWLYCK